MLVLSLYWEKYVPVTQKKIPQSSLYFLVHLKSLYEMIFRYRERKNVLMKYIVSFGKYDCLKRKPFSSWNEVLILVLKGVDVIYPALWCSSQVCKDKMLNLCYPWACIVPTFSLSSRWIFVWKNFSWLIHRHIDSALPTSFHHFTSSLHFDLYSFVSVKGGISPIRNPRIVLNFTLPSFSILPVGVVTKS